MSLIIILGADSQLGRPKLVKIFIFWFEEDVIYLYNEFKLERTSDSEKKEKSNLEKKDVQNLKNNVRGILLFYDKIPNKKPEVPTDILSLKVSLQLMANKAINQLLTTSI